MNFIPTSNLVLNLESSTTTESSTKKQNPVDFEKDSSQ